MAGFEPTPSKSNDWTPLSPCQVGQGGGFNDQLSVVLVFNVVTPDIVAVLLIKIVLVNVVIPKTCKLDEAAVFCDFIEPCSGGRLKFD